jgi:thioredoxin-like negative regulator of GroEL
MTRTLAALALIAACRGEPRRHDADLRGSASLVSAASDGVPKLPQSPNGVEELAAIDKRISIHKDEPRVETELFLERATLRGRLEDYQEAVTRSAALVASANNVDALELRARVLAAVHDFAGAREVLANARAIEHRPATQDAIEASLDEATGQYERSLPFRESMAKRAPVPANITQWAAALALVGKYDEAIALVPHATEHINDNSAELFAWLLFQWGRIHEQKGDLAAARPFYVAAHRRLPGYLEATVHLAQTMIATGDRAGAQRIIDAALAENRHPALLELAGLRDEARAEWERYVRALPAAFSDHAARFYLGLGADPRRALELAHINLANRDTFEARALVVDAALAAGDPQAGCEVVGPLATAPTHSARFAAWRALSACGRTPEADRLGRELGM